MSDLLPRLQRSNFADCSQIAVAKLEIKNRLGHLRRKQRGESDEAKGLLKMRVQLDKRANELLTISMQSASSVDSTAATQLREIASRLDSNAASVSEMSAHIASMHDDGPGSPVAELFHS